MFFKKKADIFIKSKDFPGGPGVKTLSFHFGGHRFNPWSGKISHVRATEPVHPKN